MLAFSALQALLQHCTDPAIDGFYRRFYKLAPGDPARSISTMDEWRSLPPLTKDALIEEPLAKRSYLPLSELDHLRASSGTSGKPPLFSPRTHVRHMDYRLRYHDFKNPFLAFTVPMMPHWHEIFQTEHGSAPRVIAYDPKHPAASAKLAKAAGVDALSVFVFHISALGEELKRVGHASAIRFVEITGEVCSRAQYEYLRATFPAATIVQSYNSSEVEDAHVGMPCKPMDGTEPLAVYHPKATHFLELVDPETGASIEPKAGAQGDLLITAYPGEPSAFPLIRYRIGDTVQVVQTACGHGDWSFTVLGRTELDFVKVPGGILRADEIARVLRMMPERVSDEFELHCFERPSSKGVMLEPVLHVAPKTAIDLGSFADEVATRIRVSPAMTYAEGVADGRYAPLRCEVLVKSGTAKGKRVVRHAL